MASSDNDNDLWSKIARTIQPLKDRNADPFERNNSASKKMPDRPQKPDTEKTDTGIFAPTDKDLPGDALPSGNASDTPPSTPAPPARDIDRRTLQRLKRGQFPLEGRLDLHGHSRAQARDELMQFLQISFSQGKRCVIVITGKGRKTRAEDGGFLNPSGDGILRRSLPDWLNEPQCRNMVLTWHKALPKHGGDGAFYVLLRRRKETHLS